mmetsp:Transcript_54088/g.120972  ORF Transcript_54088/g.120972 Transcript_54088/m.120972 type:complete len:82 (+) Transcript_54088:1358-1603(+)
MRYIECFTSEVRGASMSSIQVCCVWVCQIMEWHDRPLEKTAFILDEDALKAADAFADRRSGMVAKMKGKIDIASMPTSALT